MPEMARSRLALFAVLMLMGAALALPARAQNVRTIFLVRHAEKASDAPDTPLSAQGRLRAECLATMLRDAHIEKIYTSNLQRTQQTAAPLAQRLHLQPVEIPMAKPGDVDAAILAGHAANVLVVWHSRALPGIVRGLGVAEVAPMPETEYDRLTIVTMDAGSDGIAKDSHARLTVLRFCDSAK